VKKVVIIILVVLVGTILFIPHMLQFGASVAFKEENQSKPWAHKLAYNAGNINLRFFRFKAAHRILQNALETFPGKAWEGDAVFKIALAYEHDKNPEKAVEWYQRLIRDYPDHRWMQQAKKRVTNINAVQ
jgi:outer membrane protein assembly factor BamD (BamD/ComL family)